MIEILAAGFDVEAATRAYVSTLDGAELARSNRYFEGGYWLILWGALIAFLVDWFLLRFRLSHRFREWAERRTKRAWLVPGLYAVPYLLIGTLLTLPWTVYTRFFRERQYDLMEQDLGAWFGEYAIGVALNLVLLPLVVTAIYAVIRRAPRNWWLWGTGVAGALIGTMVLVGPVFIAPLFNTYTEMPDGPLRDRIVAMAAEHDVPADNIYVFDQSKQTKRISANVSGIGPTIRISLNDNLLERTSDEEVLAVMGHELGHYVRGHVVLLFAALLAIVAAGLFIASRAAPWLIARHGERWGVRDLADPASVPVLGLILTVYFLGATPILNTIIRVNEVDADAFGLDASREPDGMARVDMRLSEYRKISPGPIEEFIFFDHPSGESRVRMAMEWKARNVKNPRIIIPPADFMED